MSARPRLWLALWLLLCLTLAFARNLGLGFIGDDFEWLRRGDLRSMADASEALLQPVAGHYRPLVAVTFIVNHLLTGLSPLGHGLVNLGVACVAAALVGRLAAANRLGSVGAATAATLWLFNPDTVGPATTAMAGRSGLLASLCSATAALAILRGQRGIAALGAGAAVASHETMWPLPLVIVSWLAVDGGTRGILPLARRVWPVAAAVTAVVLVRLAVLGSAGATGSMGTPAGSPLVGAPVDHGGLGLLFATAVVTTSLALSPVLHLDGDERRALLKGMLWLTPGAAHIVNSLLGLVSPTLDPAALSVGVALAGASAAKAIARRLSARPRLLWAGAILVPMIAVPLQWQRNAAGRADAQFATNVLQRLFGVLRERSDIRRVELYQAAGETPSIQSALGSGTAAALELGTGRRLEIYMALTAPADPWPAPRAFTVRLTVSGDEMVAVAPPLER